ncbi:MAG: SRPBCC family protein [Polyangiaceae bacterium]
MTEQPVVHSTFAIKRNYAASPTRVFAAFADKATKRRWFLEGKGSEVDEFTTDFRVGGREQSRFRFKGGPDGAPSAGTAISNDTTYQDIVPDRRIVFAYTMTVGGKRISASLATVELVPSGDGTRLTFTEQAAFFEGADGPQRREEGWGALLQNLADELAKMA